LVSRRTPILRGIEVLGSNPAEVRCAGHTALIKPVKEKIVRQPPDDSLSSGVITYEVPLRMAANLAAQALPRVNWDRLLYRPLHNSYPLQ
jgi:hypothetical protein